MKMIYGVKDRPPVGRLILFALQQLLAILAATIAVPMVVGNGMSPSAALFGAGVGTIVYLLFTKFKSPVFLGSSFAFLGSMAAAFAGGVSASLGYLGLLLGALFAGLIYVIIAVVVKFAGVKWIDKIMPAVVIGPTVAIIGLSLAGNAIGDLMKGNVSVEVTEYFIEMVEGVPTIAEKTASQMLCSPYIALLCGLTTLIVTVVCSVYGKKLMKMIPFIIGILAGYVLAAAFTGIGYAAKCDALKVIDFSQFKHMQWYPDFAFLKAFKGGYSAGDAGSVGAYIGTIAVAYIPVAFVVFAEHIADHKNISSIIESDLLKDRPPSPRPADTPRAFAHASRRRNRLCRGRVFRRLPQHHLRRVRRLRGNIGQCFGYNNSRYGGACNRKLVHSAVRNVFGDNTVLRNGRRMYRALRLYCGVGS